MHPAFGPPDRRTVAPRRRQTKAASLLRISSACALLIHGVAAAGERLEIDRVVLKVIEQVHIPSQDAGVIDQVLAKEGDVLESGQVIGRVDSTAARLLVERGMADLRLSEHSANNRLPLELARKGAQQAAQSLAEGEILRDIAAQVAKDDTQIRAASKAHGVAANELQRHLAAKEQSPQSVSESRIDGLRLMADKAALEAEHARLEHDLNTMRTTAQIEAVKRLQLAAEEAKVKVDDTQSDLVAAALEADLKRRELDIARHSLERRQLRSPIEGIVVEVLHHAGEWVEPGEPILRVLRVNRLRAEGFISAGNPVPGLKGASALVRIPRGSGGHLERSGKVVFVNPEVDPVNNQRRVWIEFDNADLELLPGMLGSALIELQPSP